MESKIMRVFYDNNGYPFKDSTLETRYPIIGSEFTGANNTTELYFYTGNIDSEFEAVPTYIANIVLPDGTLLYRIVDYVADTTYNGYTYYHRLILDSEITSKKGKVYISLNGYYGSDVTITETTITIDGTPLIIATGTIQIAMNYAPLVVPIGVGVEYSDVQHLLYALATLQTRISELESDVVGNYVPYTGATQDVDLGDNTITANAFITGNTSYGNVAITYYYNNTLYTLVYPRGDEPYVNNIIATRSWVERTDHTFTGTLYKTSSDYPVNEIISYADLGVVQEDDDEDVHVEDKVWIFGVDNPPYKNGVISTTNELASVGEVRAVGHTIEMTINDNYVITLKLKDYDGNTLGTAQTIDLPLESVVVSGYYDNTAKQLKLELENGTIIAIPVGDLISGLASESDLQAVESRVDTLEALGLSVVNGQLCITYEN